MPFTGSAKAMFPAAAPSIATAGRDVVRHGACGERGESAEDEPDGEAHCDRRQLRALRAGRASAGSSCAARRPFAGRPIMPPRRSGAEDQQHGGKRERTAASGPSGSRADGRCRKAEHRGSTRKIAPTVKRSKRRASSSTPSDRDDRLAVGAAHHHRVAELAEPERQREVQKIQLKGDAHKRPCREARSVPLVIIRKPPGSQPLDECGQERSRASAPASARSWRRRAVRELSSGVSRYQIAAAVIAIPSAAETARRIIRTALGARSAARRGRENPPAPASG